MLNCMSTLAAGGDLMSHVLPHKLHDDPLFSVGGYDFYITNHLLMTLVAALLLIIVFVHVAKRVRVTGSSAEDFVTKGRIAQLFETICQFLRDEVARPALGHHTDRFISFIWTTFFFILFCNLLGMVPIGYALQLITGNQKLAHWSGTATGNIAVTAGLAIVAFLMIHVSAIRELGLWGWLKHHMPGPVFLAPLMLVLEFAGDLIKPFALCVRLFANMVAGHLVIAALLGMIFTFGKWFVVPGSIIGSVGISLLELFVAFLQAYIFTFLTVLFIAAFVAHEEHEEHEDHEETESAEEAAEAIHSATAPAANV